MSRTVPLLVVGILAGCMHSPTDVGGAAAAASLHAFSAVYEFNEGSTMAASFGLGQAVRGPDLAMQPAYLLRVELSGPIIKDWAADPFVMEWAVDGALRTARVYSPCDPISCNPSHIDWRPQGSIPFLPLGLGAGPRSYIADGQQIGVNPAGNRVDVPAAASSRATFFWIPEGRFQFEDSWLVPTHVAFSNPFDAGKSAITGSIRSLSWGAPLVPIPAWQSLRPASGLQAIDVADVPDAGWDPFHRGYTLGRSFEELRSRASSVDEILARGGCIVGYDVVPRAGYYRAPIAGALLDQNETKTYWKLFDPPSSGVTYVVSATHWQSQVLQWNAEQVESANWTGFGEDWCDRTQQSLRTRSMTPQEALEWFQSAGRQTGMTQDWVSFGSARTDLIPGVISTEFGAERYYFAWHAPGRSGGVPYSIEARAATGTWDVMNVHPDLVRTFDASTWSAPRP